jgi:hypothetical protein
MSYMFEVFYRKPPDPTKEQKLTERVSHFGGHLTFREEPGDKGPSSVCLTYEFDSSDQARAAATSLREQGEYVEGPVDYEAGPALDEESEP